jgi:hypothetical protein
MIFHQRGALAAGGERLLILPFYEVAETVNCTAECACFLVAPMQFNGRSQKAGPVRHTSTNFFVMWKSSRLDFSAMLIHLLNSSRCQVPR